MIGCAAGREAERPRADWGRAADGIQMAGFAVFLLLNTTGVLPWSFWLDAISLWPVLIIAAGLTFLETVANPYATVLGPTRYAATRINLAQSFNPVGLIFGPIIGGVFFYSTDAAGRSTGSETLYIPYLVVAIVVVVLAVVFSFAYMPDIKAEDGYHLGETTPGVSHSIWKHPHFAMAVGAQFLYVAAQAGIFSFFINYMTEEVPPIPAAWHTDLLKSWFETDAAGLLRIVDAVKSPWLSCRKN